MDQNIPKIISELKIKSKHILSGRQAFIIINHADKAINELGLEVLTRVKVTHQEKTSYADVLIAEDDQTVKAGEMIISERLYKNLGFPQEGTMVKVSRQMALSSFAAVRGKMFGKEFTQEEMYNIVKDIAEGAYDDAHLSSFVTACAGGKLSRDEIVHLTDAMVKVGHTLNWGDGVVVDKHCIGGLAGNRTTPIVVAIVAAAGLRIPKTSSRAITSPAGTADVLEVLTTVALDFNDIKQIVGKTNGCLVWGGSSDLSPADDIIINIERPLDIDSEGQMIASVTSKKIAAGSTHVLIDIPVGPSAKVRTMEKAQHLKELFEYVGAKLGTKILAVITDGTQPIGKGIGPALEARDVVDVLQNKPEAPQDLRDKSLKMSGLILEFSGKVPEGKGYEEAQKILESGAAWTKVQEILQAQGGIKEIPSAQHTYEQKASKNGKITAIDNRKVSQAAKLAGAPEAKASGMELFKHLNDVVKEGDLLYRVHAETKGGLQAALDLLHDRPIYTIE